MSNVLLIIKCQCSHGNALWGNSLHWASGFSVYEMAMAVKWAVGIRNPETPSLEIIILQRPLNLSPLPLCHPTLHLAVTHMVCGCWGSLGSYSLSTKLKEIHGPWSSIQTPLQSDPRKPPVNQNSLLGGLQSHVHGYPSFLPADGTLPKRSISSDLKYKAFPETRSSGLRWWMALWDKVRALYPR